MYIIISIKTLIYIRCNFIDKFNLKLEQKYFYRLISLGRHYHMNIINMLIKLKYINIH